MGVDFANGAVGVRHHADAAGQLNGRFPNSAMHGDIIIVLRVASQIQANLAHADVHFETSQGQASQVQLGLARAHVDDHVYRSVVVESHVPIVSDVVRDPMTSGLGNAQDSAESGGAVANLGLPTRDVVAKVRFHHLLRASADVHFTRTHFQIGAQQFRFIAFNASG